MKKDILSYKKIVANDFNYMDTMFCMKKMNGVSCIIFKDNKILLQLRDSKTENFPNNWGLIGGTEEINESPEHAIIREIKEEIDSEITNLKLIRTYSFKNKKEYAFVANLKPGSKITLNEGEKYEWVELLKLNEYTIRPDDKETIEQYFEKNDNK